MRTLILGILISFGCFSQCFGYGSIACFDTPGGSIKCVPSHDLGTPDRADYSAKIGCPAQGCWIAARFVDECVSVVFPTGKGLVVGRGNSPDAAHQNALSTCRQSFNGSFCESGVSVCDGTPQTTSVPTTTRQPAGNTAPDAAVYRAPANGTMLDDIRTGLGLGLGFAVFIVVFAKRAAILNYVANGGLPYKLSNYADDIEVLFTRTQRVNWYGRVVFGIVARLGMTDHQLVLVRRYWLGRVIAFDSFRRQRQNQLAKMHLQLAAAGGVPVREVTGLRLLWVVLKRIVLFVFGLFRALVSLLFGFLFIRVTIAKLARGKLVESKDLALLLEAKTAIEETAVYLKEYLEVAETFNDQEELFEPRGPIHAVLEAIHGRREAQPQGNASPIRRGRGAVSS